MFFPVSGSSTVAVFFLSSSFFCGDGGVGCGADVTGAGVGVVVGVAVGGS